MELLLLSLLTLSFFLIAVILKCNRDKQLKGLIKHTKRRFENYIIDSSKDGQLIDPNRLVELVFDHQGNIISTTKAYDFGCYHEIIVKAGKYQDSYYYLPRYVPSINLPYPRSNRTESNTHKSFMHHAHIELVNTVSWKQEQLKRPITRKELDVILLDLRMTNPLVIYSDFKITSGWVKIRVYDVNNFESYIEQLIPVNKLNGPL